MTRWTLCAAIAAAFAAAPAGAAVTMNADGTGQGLLFPYFSTHNGQSTLINVHNTSNDGKALKVRVLESERGAVTLAYNIYLAPGAIWNAALVQDDASPIAPAVLKESGRVCAAPFIPAEGWELRPYDFAGDGGMQTGDRTREGFVEIIELGTLSDALAERTADPTDANCIEFVNRHMPGGVWATNPNADLAAPTGGLRGSAVLVDTADGTSFDYPALAFDGLATAPRQLSVGEVDGDNLILPALTDIQVAAGDDVIVHLPGTQADGSAVTLRYDADDRHHAISALLASHAAQHRFSIEPGLRARTEWIYSFPTLRAHRDHMIVGTPPPNALNAPPFAANSGHCEVVSATFSDRNGAVQTEDEVSLCGVAGVVRFAAEGSPAAPIVALEGDVTSLTGDVTIDPLLDSGTVSMDFSTFNDGPRRSQRDLDDNCFVGLPVWSMALSAYDNDNAQAGRIATFPVDDVAARGTTVIDCSAN